MATERRGHVMRGAGLVPAVHELARANRELHAHVRVTKRENGPVDVLTLGHHKLEVTVAVLRDAQERHRTQARIELGEVAAAGLAVEHRDHLERGLLGRGDGRVARTGVTDDDDVLGEVDGVHLRELTGAGDGLQDAHGHGDLHVALDRARRPLLDEHRERRDEHGVEHARLALGVAVIVARHQADLLVTHPLLKRQHVARHLLDGLVRNRGAALHVKRVENLGRLRVDCRLVIHAIGNGPHLLPVELLGVETQAVVEVGLVDVEVHHARIGAANLGNVGAAQAATHLGGTAPLVKLARDLWVAALHHAGDDRVTLARAVEVGYDLAGGAASVEVAQPGGDVGRGVVGLRLLLHVHHHHGHVEVAHRGQHVVGGRVGEHLQDHQVNVGGAELVARLLGLLLGGHHAAVHKLNRRRQRCLEVGVLLLKVRNELGELRQVRAEGDGEHAHLGASLHERGARLS